MPGFAEIHELGHTFLFDHTEYPNIRVWSRGQTQVRDRSYFPEQLEEAVYDSANFKPTFNYHTYMLNFFLGFVLTLPHNHLQKKFAIGDIFVKYEQSGKLKIFMTASADLDFKLIYKYVDTTGNDPYDPTSVSLNEEEIAEVIHKLKAKKWKVTKFNQYLGDQYFIRPKSLDKTAPEHSQHQNLQDNSIKMEVLHRSESAIEEWFNIIKAKLHELPVNNEFVEVKTKKNARKLDKLLQEINGHNERDVKLGVETFLGRLMEIYQQSNLNEFSSKLSFDPIDICGFIHGAVTLGYKQRYFSYFQVENLKMSFELKPKIWTSKSTMPVMIDFINYDYLEVEEARLQKVWDATGQKVNFRTNAMTILYAMLACESNKCKIKSNSVKIRKPHGLVKVLTDGAQKLTANEMTTEQMRKNILSEIDHILPIENFYYKKDTKYLSRFILGLLSTIKRDQTSCYLAKPKVKKDGHTGILDPITTFVLGNPNLPYDIQINVVEKDQYNADYDTLIDQVTDHLILSKSHTDVTDVIKVNIKVEFDQSMNDLVNDEAMKVKMNIKIDVGLIKNEAPADKITYDLEPIKSIAIEATINSIKQHETSEHGLNSQDLVEFFTKNKQFVKDDTQLRALVNGLFFTTEQKLESSAGTKLSLGGFYQFFAKRKSISDVAAAVFDAKLDEPVDTLFKIFPDKSSNEQVILVLRGENLLVPTKKVNGKNKLIVLNFEYNKASVVSEVDSKETLEILKMSSIFDHRTVNEQMIDKKFINFVISPNAEEDNIVTSRMLKTEEIMTEEKKVCLIMRKKRDAAKCIEYYEDEEHTRDQLKKLLQFEKSYEIKSDHEKYNHRDILMAQNEIHSHLRKLSMAAKVTMYGLIGKDTLADMYNGDWEGVGINTGFIVGSIALGKISQKLSTTGAKLVSAEKVLLGTSLKIGASFLSRGTSAFIMYDLYNSVQRYKSGDKDAMADIVGDGAFLAIDMAEIGIEIAEAMGAISAEISAITGPIGEAIGVCILVGVEIYKAAKTVEHINALIHLSRTETFYEGLHAFFGIGPEPYIQHLMDEKIANNRLMQIAVKSLISHEHIQRYISPTGCLCEKSHVMQAMDQHIDLRQKINTVKWNRATPDVQNATNLFCMPVELDLDEELHVLFVKKTTDKFNPYHYECVNAFGLVDKKQKNQNVTFMNLGHGNDYAYGFIDSPNIFSIGNGTKEIQGGNDKDVFMLIGNLTNGYLNGLRGYNILDLSNYAFPSIIKLKDGVIRVYNSSSRTYHSHLEVRNIQEVIGRKNYGDHIAVSCNLRHLNSQGGNNNRTFGRDVIRVPNSNCSFNLTIEMYGNTYVTNDAKYGRFNYLVSNISGHTSLTVLDHHSESLHIAKFHYNLYDIIWIIREFDNDDTYSITMCFSANEEDVANENFTTLVPFSIHGAYENCTLLFSDNATIKISASGEHAFLSTTLSSRDIIAKYEPVADRLNMLIVAFSIIDNASVIIGTSKFMHYGHLSSNVIHNDPLHESHLIGGDAPNVFTIVAAAMSGNESKPIHHIPNVIIYRCIESHYNDTINLSALKQQIKNQWPDCELQHNATVLGDDIVVTLFLSNATMSDVVTTVIMKNAQIGKAYRKFSIVIDVPMKIRVTKRLKFVKSNKSPPALLVTLIPMPLVFPNNISVIAITDNDIDENQRVIVQADFGSQEYYRYNDSLIISNIEHCQQHEIKLLSVVLTNFYHQNDISNKMASMVLDFNDLRIILRHDLNDIIAAKVIDDISDIMNAP